MNISSVDNNNNNNSSILNTNGSTSQLIKGSNARVKFYVEKAQDQLIPSSTLNQRSSKCIFVILLLFFYIFYSLIKP